MTVTVSDFYCDEATDQKTVLLDLGEGFNSLKDLVRCELMLEIYAADDSQKLLYASDLGAFAFE